MQHEFFRGWGEVVNVLYPHQCTLVWTYEICPECVADRDKTRTVMYFGKGHHCPDLSSYMQWNTCLIT